MTDKKMPKEMQDECFEFTRDTLIKTIKKCALEAINLPINQFPESEFESLPEYPLVISAINNYVHAIEKESYRFYGSIPDKILEIYDKHIKK